MHLRCATPSPVLDKRRHDRARSPPGRLRMPDTLDWTHPRAMAIPPSGYTTEQRGRYGAIYPRTPACYGFTIIAKIKPGTEQEIRAYGKTIEDAVALFSASGITTIFTKLEGFPEDWKTNAPAFVKFVREHHHPSFLEYGEYPYATATE